MTVCLQSTSAVLCRITTLLYQALRSMPCCLQFSLKGQLLWRPTASLKRATAFKMPSPDMWVLVLTCFDLFVEQFSNSEFRPWKATNASLACYGSFDALYNLNWSQPQNILLANLWETLLGQLLGCFDCNAVGGVAELSKPTRLKHT